MANLFDIPSKNNIQTDDSKTVNNENIFNTHRIRKLTPKECWRLMGFTDEQFDKAMNDGVSKTQLYKQAGNSIVVDVMASFFRNLFSPDEHITVNELFSGIGAQRNALTRANISHTIIGISDIDKYALQSYKCYLGKHI